MGFVGDAISGAASGIGNFVGGALPGPLGGLVKGGFNAAGSVASTPFNMVNDLSHGDFGGALGDLGNGLTGGFKDVVSGIAGGLGIHMPDLGGPPSAPDNSDVTSKNNALNSVLQSRLNLQQSNADQVKSDADSFKANLPQYEAGQISNATDQAKSALTNDIYNAKASANSRGLTYSGLNTQGQQDAQVKESSKLAGDIQNINTQANNLSDQKQQNAFNAQSGVAQSQVDLASAQAQQSESAYQAALQEQQMQTQYYGSLMQAAGSAAGGLIGIAGKVL